MERKEKLKFEEIKKCPECGGRIIHDEYRGEYYCQKCGLVISSEEFQKLPEWRAFTPEQREERPRAGPPLKPGEKPTTIIFGTKDGYGKPLSPKEMQAIHRIKKWHGRVTRRKGESIPDKDITGLISLLNLTREVRSLSIQIYGKAKEQGILKGRDKKEVAAAAVYAAIRLLGIPLPPDNISEASGTEKKGILRVYKEIKRNLHLEIKPADIKDYIIGFSEKLELSEGAKEKALEIYQEAKEKRIISGKSPTGLAAGIIYIASILTNDRRTQKKIGEVAGVTEVTVRNRFKEIAKKLNISVPPYYP